MNEYLKINKLIKYLNNLNKKLLKNKLKLLIDK